MKTFGEGLISKDHLSRLYTILTRGSAEQIEKSFPCAQDRSLLTRSRSGENKLHEVQKQLLFTLREYYVSMTYAAIHKLFIESWFGNFDQNAARFSVATIRNACVADHFSRKDPVATIQSTKLAIEHFPSCNLVSIDGLKVSHSDYNARRGYARTSMRAIQRQFIIRAMD
jgi:hypothetical protein